MDTITLTIDDIETTAQESITVLEVAQDAGIYIPRLCAHPGLPSSRALEADEFIYQGSERIENDNSVKEFEGCQLCVVEIEGVAGFPNACVTPATQGMVVHTNTPQLRELRQEKLIPILTTHPHACLICAQREGCSREPCSVNVPVNERCCTKFGNCELQRVTEYIGIKPETPRYSFGDLPITKEEPLFKRDYNLCIGCLRCVRICQEVRGINALGFVFRDGKVVVGAMGPTLNKSGCKFCGACIEICPTGALMDREVAGAQREAALVPCRHNCPAGIDVPRYVSLIAEEKFAEAVAVIREKVPFPAVLGDICPHPCEDDCRRGQINDSICIRMLKRSAAEHDSGLWKLNPNGAPATGKRAAIVGSGPAGLTAAYYLAKLGHSATVLEALSEPGGMMRVGIPDYRLPKDILKAEIKEIESIGVDIKTNMKIDSVEWLFEQGYNTIFLAVGAHQGIKMDIEGEDNPGVMECISFLRDVNLGKTVELGDKVAVIGGGNAAIDSARTALRLGAKEVTIVYRRSRDEMPASPEEIEGALAEGVNIKFLAAPLRITSQNGDTQLDCIRIKLGAVDASGRRRPEPIEGSEFSLNFDNIIAATGQRPEIPAQFGLSAGQGNTIKVDRNTLATEVEAVFAGGDSVTGPASVIEAIAAGRQAAASIDKYLGGDGIIDEVLVDAGESNPWLGRDGDFADRLGAQMPCLSAGERLRDFTEVEFGFDKEAAVKEANRCLRCDLRLHIPSPPYPPKEEGWLEFNSANVSPVPEIEGVYQLLDEQKAVIYIAGTMNLRQGLEEHLGATEAPLNKACYFLYEENPMYTVKESELIQQFSQQHGQMPAGNQDLDDLF